MAFAKSVFALLDTYANCISLLKAFKHRREETSSDGAQHARLRKSLRSDRSLVERAYSSKLSESGSRLKKGDARAVSALDRILNRLKKAITNLLRLSSQKDGLGLDYASLMTLSNSSRIDAVKTIDSLSRRLGSPSRSSVASSLPHKASSRRKKRPSCNSDAAPRKQSKEPRSKDSPSIKKTSSAVKAGKAQRKHHRKPETTEHPKNAPKPKASTPSPKPLADTRTPTTPLPLSKISRNPSNPVPPETRTTPNRISILSFSSDSTKLGEIPQRKWQSTTAAAYYATDRYADSSGEYNVRPVFPLRSYTAEVKGERERGRWLGLFGRRREG